MTLCWFKVRLAADDLPVKCLIPTTMLFYSANVVMAHFCLPHDCLSQSDYWPVQLLLCKSDGEFISFPVTVRCRFVWISTYVWLVLCQPAVKDQLRLVRLQRSQDAELLWAAVACTSGNELTETEEELRTTALYPHICTGLTSPVDVHATGTGWHTWVNECLFLGTPKDVSRSLHTPVMVSDRKMSG